MKSLELRARIGRAAIYRFGGLATESHDCSDGLSHDSSLLSDGAIWFDVAASASGVIDSNKHRGGLKRVSRQDYGRFLNMAEASLAEAEYLLMVSRDLGYMAAKEVGDLFTELTKIARMLNSLQTKVAASNK